MDRLSRRHHAHSLREPTHSTIELQRRLTWMIIDLLLRRVSLHHVPFAGQDLYLLFLPPHLPRPALPHHRLLRHLLLRRLRHLLRGRRHLPMQAYESRLEALGRGARGPMHQRERARLVGRNAQHRARHRRHHTASTASMEAGAEHAEEASRPVHVFGRVVVSPSASPLNSTHYFPLSADTPFFHSIHAHLAPRNAAILEA